MRKLMKINSKSSETYFYINLIVLCSLIVYDGYTTNGIMVISRNQTN